ncbi:MAG: hypothetical protein JXR34_00150 [Bacteroidales bacterium]|nr:hypothetical protein [Bacteroidales bacterium]
MNKVCMIHPKPKLLLIFELDFFYRTFDDNSILKAYARSLSRFFDLAVISFSKTPVSHSAYDLQTVVDDNLILLNFTFKESSCLLLNVQRQRNVFNMASEILLKTWSKPMHILYYSCFPYNLNSTFFNNLPLFYLPLNYYRFYRHTSLLYLPKNTTGKLKFNLADFTNYNVDFFPYPVFHDYDFDAISSDELLFVFWINSTGDFSLIVNMLQKYSYLYRNKICIYTNSDKLKKSIRRNTNLDIVFIDSDSLMSKSFYKGILFGDFQVVTRLMFFFLQKRIPVLTFLDYMPDFFNIEFMLEYVSVLNWKTVEITINQFLQKDSIMINDEIMDNLREEYGGDYIAIKLKLLLEHLDSH